ncbi:glycosyl hydrolase family 32 [Cryptosporangium sp. NPDC051539]|uniref:glycosyl hydrolase family 32 n=1 Tax=Cryptosporangium sp. NPDC051539 TaxID=3363962 RepID=UPI0037BC5603
MLRLSDDWVWDSWVADTGTEYHLFFLKAPRSLADPALRHGAATIGHAVSGDLTSWRVLPDALRPVASGWESLAVWTGSVVRGPDGAWRLYYTGVTRAGSSFGQRIGLAESPDLVTWRRAGLVLSADPRWYRTLGGGVSTMWRDPFVFADPGGDGWHMLITAADASGGVLAHARSSDLREWEVGPPVTRGGGFGETEVAQVRVVDGTPVLTFTCHPREQTPGRRAAGDYCTWTVVGESPTGPWDLGRARPFAADPDLFAAPLVRGRDGGWVYLGFRNGDVENGGVEAFEVVDPIPVALVDGAMVPVVR